MVKDVAMGDMESKPSPITQVHVVKGQITILFKEKYNSIEIIINTTSHCFYQSKVKAKLLTFIPKTTPEKSFGFAPVLV